MSREEDRSGSDCWPWDCACRLIYAVFVAVGFVLLIIPGIILAARLSLYGFLMVDKGLGPRAALTRSAELTQGAVWDLFVFGLLLFGIVVLGALALFVGLFVALPTILMASAYVYRKLLAQAEGSAATPAPPPVPAPLP
ncbi:MAG: DUF975 family protein [Armatimonadota bacterium]